MKYSSDLKKEIKRLGNTVNGFINSIQVYANFMDNFFDSEENRNFYADVYVEYKEYSNSIKSVLIDNGFVKEKNNV